MNPPRLNTLISLRYLFAVGAVAVHLLPIWAADSYALWPASLHNLLNAAYLALPFFYALSGFVLFYMYRCNVPQSRASRLTFWGKRLARICPIFYLSLALGISVLIAEKGYGTTSPAQGVGYLALNLAFLSAWIPSSLIINFPTWSVSVEIFCYFLFPLLLPRFVSISRKNAWLGLCFCFFLGAAVQIFAAQLYPALWQWPWQVRGVSVELTNFLELHPLVHFPEFLFGIFLARAWELRAPESALCSDLILGSGMVVIIALLLSGIPWPFLMLTSFLFLPAIGLLLWGAAGTRGVYTRWLEFPLLLLLGEASYAVYAFHMPLSYWFSHFYSPLDHPYRIFLLFLLFLTAVAVGAHRFYELPIRRFLLRKLKVRN